MSLLTWNVPSVMVANVWAGVTGTCVGAGVDAATVVIHTCETATAVCWNKTAVAVRWMQTAAAVDCVSGFV